MITMLKKHVSNITIFFLCAAAVSLPTVTAMETPYNQIMLTNLLNYPISLLQSKIKSRQSLIIIGLRIPAYTTQLLPPLYTTHLTFLLPNNSQQRFIIPIGKKPTEIIIKKGPHNKIFIIEQKKPQRGWIYSPNTI